MKSYLPVLALAVVLVTAVFWKFNPAFGVTDTTTFTNPIAFSQTVAITGATSITGAATLASTLGVTGKVTTDGGIVHSYPLSTSTPASMTLAASDLTAYESIVMLPTVGSITVTLPASSTLSSAVSPTAGDWEDKCITNATTTSGQNITLAGGTGTSLLVASSSATALGSKVLFPGKTGCFKVFRIGAGNNASDLNFLLTVFQ
jgi:cell wall-associated NlpC family hydrolase